MGRQIAKRVSKQYNCTMAELYSGLETIWYSQKEHEIVFENESTVYVPGTWSLRLAEIEKAQKMPDGQARGAQSEVLRIEMIEKMYDAAAKWNSLKGYISHAFKGEHYKPRIEEAGKGYYFNSIRKNWEDLRLLLQSGRNFILKHEVVLKNEGGMPAGFVAKFETVANDFEDLYKRFMKARQDAKEQTDAKVMANNLIFEDGKAMMRDAQRIFRKQAAVRNRFVWRRVLGLVRSGEVR
jgi:hypothetical protein